MRAVVIAAPRGDERLELSVDDGGSRSDYDLHWTARLETGSLSATHGFYSGVAPKQLVAYFDALAADWRGWDGRREFAAIEHDFELAAWHDGRGHVELWVTLGTEMDSADRNWLVRDAIRLEAGGLDAVARAVRPFAD